MMGYQLFKDVIMERLPALLPPMYADCELKISTVQKVNQEKETLHVIPKHQEGDLAAMPNIYLDDMYEAFQNCEDMDKILEDIVTWVIQFTGRLSVENVDLDFTKHTDSIVMNLINAERNQKLLELAPHKEVMDLAVIYRIVMNQGESGLDTILITNDIMASLGLTLERLDALAYENTVRMFPAKTAKLTDHLYMMTNSVKIHGATTMLYKEAIRKKADQTGGNLFIIPSSIHEVMLVPEKSAELPFLIRTLSECNQLYVEEKEILSNTIYFYNRKKDCLTMAASYFS